MPKSIIVDPEKVFARGAIHLSDIQVNAYQRTGEEELATYSPEEFLAIWQDMCAIRQFETILNDIKTKGAFQGLAYNHAGPAHLSIGQEAAAVGMAFSLAVVVYLLWGLLLSLIKHPSLSPVELSRIVPPEPRLQTSPETDLARLLARDRQQLASVGWVDRNTGTVHIPVDRAMQILAGRGWPNPQENGSRQ